MSRIPPAPSEVFVPVFGEHADLRTQVFANAPELAKAMVAFSSAAQVYGRLDPRLIELVRLRVSFFNQCRTCMATRYMSAGEGLTEGLVCSLERPQDAPDLTEAERAALLYSEMFATDHLSITDAMFEDLRRHFDDGELMELSFRIASFVGFGRMTAILDISPEQLPDRFRRDGVVTPWGDGPVLHSGGVVSGASVVERPR